MSNRIKSDDIQIGSNYVLPIEQSNVTVQQAKVKKIIAETDARAQQIIDGAENKSQIIVQTANTEAQRIIEDARRKAQEEYEAIKNQAYQEGFAQGEQDGHAKFQNDAHQALESLDTMSSSVFDIKKNIIDSATLDIVELVSAIADKVCHVKFDEEVLKNITIIVNPELVDNINTLVPTFREEIPKLETIRVVEDNSVSPDGVIVETLNTRLDSRVSVQIEEIAQKMLTGADDELE